MKVRKTGLFLFYSGLIFLTLSLGLTEYRLSRESFNLSVMEEHRSQLQAALLHMEGITYHSKFRFVHDFESVIDELNEGFRQNNEWNKVIYESYSFPVVKHSTYGPVREHPALFFCLSFALICLGGFLFFIPVAFYSSPGIRNNHLFFSSVKNRGFWGILLGTSLIAFYIALYQFPAYLANWTIMLDPLSLAMSGEQADQWFLYGFIYCLAMLVMGLRMYIRYRHNKYQKIRTFSVAFFQLCFAFTLPQVFRRLHLPAYDLKSAWPLEYTFFFDYRLDEHIAAGTMGIWMLVWGIVLFTAGIPVLTFFYGKRWYCSWVCGCGGLAETLGDPFRQLSDKGIRSWKIERYMVHSVLLLSVIMTSAVLYTYFTGSTSIAGISTYDIRDSYGFLIGFAFAGVVGTGFYPIMGNRVWCRFGCPLAAYLGLIQRFRSRFRITTNGGQCISCGNCSTYCEMGIDVRWYAQRGQNIVRSSCVGCGVCASVCPRGVLKLENAPVKGRINDDPILIGNSGASLNM